MSKIIKCKNCGADIDSDAKYCLKCGVFNKYKPFYTKWWLVLIIAFLLVVFLGIVGAVGSKYKKQDTAKDTTASAEKQEVKTDTSTKDDSKKEENKKTDTKVTYENFMKVQMGQSYEEVKALLGEGKESSSSDTAGIKTVTYEWRGTGMGNMNITFQNDGVMVKAQAFLQEQDANITMDKYNQIQNGMTYEQVKDILGEGELTSETKIMDSDSKLYSYTNKDGSNANFTFSGDSMEAKAQFNLK